MIVFAGYVGKGSKAYESQLQVFAKETATSLRKVAKQEDEIRRLRQINESGLRERLVLNRRLQEANDQVKPRSTCMTQPP